MVQLYKRKGGEVLVNTETANQQSGATIAILPGGGFVITWTDNSLLGGDASSFGIKAQLFDAGGDKVGGEFLVNTTTTGNQTGSTVAALASGRFVITWTDASLTGGDTSGNAVRGQLFEANGSKVGSEFLVNTATTNGQNSPSISELSGGGFVITWTDGSLVGGDTSGTGIKAQIFDANATKVGGEILLNIEDTGGSQSAPSVIGLPSGGFAAVWQAPVMVFNGVTTGGIRLALFDSAGMKIGHEQETMSSTVGSFSTSNITALATGFIVTWAQTDAVQSPFLPGSSDVHAQLFDANGVKVGGDFVVNSTTAGAQSAADVDLLPGGGFIITWSGPGEGTSGFNVYGQVFDSSGAKVGGEFVIAGSDGTQNGARVDVLPNGDIVVIYNDGSGVGDTSSFGIKMQVLTLSTDAPTDMTLSATEVSETAREGAGLITLTSSGAINSTFAYQIVSDSTGGAFGIVGDKLVVLDNSLLDFEAHPTASVRIRTTDLNGNSYEETFQLNISDTPEGGYTAAAGEFLVNTTTNGDQSEPVLLALASGGFVATWTSTAGTSGQLFDADGAKVGGELSLNSSQAMVALANGGFVSAGTAPDGSQVGIIVTFYNAAGVATGAAIPVNTTITNEQSYPSIAQLTNGNFVVTWTDFVMTTTLSTVKAQILDSSGNKIGGEISVPAVASGIASEVTALGNGNFVITWTDGSGQAQIFTAAGARFGQQFTVTDLAAEPHITALADGGFVVSYAHTNSGVDHLTVQIYDANGHTLGDSILISENGPSQVNSTSIAALPWGGFVIAWADKSDPGEPSNDDGIRAQVFDATGAPVGDQILVNNVTASGQVLASVTVLESGAFAIGWYGDDGSGSGIKARIFTLEESAPATPTEGPDTLNGTPNADTIDGLGGDDVINGLAGNDVLIGGSGADTMAGGANDDTYFVDNALDQVIEAANEGFDTVFSAVSYALAAGSEIEVLSAVSWGSTAALNFTGNSGANIVYGNAGDNSLNGGGGADILIGFGGNDNYFVDNASDLVLEASGAGQDSVFALVSYVLAEGSEVEVLSTVSFGATTAINLTGNGLHNIVYGNAGVNTLDGGGGADVLIGFGGDDFYIVDNAGDVLIEGAGQGFDTAYARADYALFAGSQVEVLSTISWSAATAISLTGNEFTNFLYGNAGANTLNGGGGADQLTGFGGADTFAFTTALGGGNVDSIADFVAGTDKIALDDAIFTQAGAPGALNGNAFVTGTAAADADDRIIYNSATGQLFYDADGNGAGAAVLFATVTGNPALTASDFMVI